MRKLILNIENKHYKRPPKEVNTDKISLLADIAKHKRYYVETNWKNTKKHCKNTCFLFLPPPPVFGDFSKNMVYAYNTGAFKTMVGGGVNCTNIIILSSRISRYWPILSV